MSIYDSIKSLYHEKKVEICKENINPYRILMETDDEIIAYYSSIPLYSFDNHLIIPRWKQKANSRFFNGINAVITVTEEEINLKNDIGFAKIGIKGNAIAEPTFNGVVIECDGPIEKITLQTDKARDYIENGSCFSLLQTEFLPFLNIGGIYGSDEKKEFPVSLTSRKIGDKTFEIIIDGGIKAFKLLFEISLYTEKIVFDTTVESKNPHKNNVFGNVAFLGFTKEYGEQWLYMRFDCLHFFDLNSYLTEKAKLYLPKIGGDKGALKAYRLNKAWCSYGTNWENKVESFDVKYEVQREEQYEVIEVTEIIKEILNFQQPRDPGLLIKNESKHGYSIVATADSYYQPQILEIRLRKS